MRVPWKAALAGSLVVLAAVAPIAHGKEIVRGATPSENTIYIRTDGLVCYFCAYGLERFFKKTGRIAAFDMDMKAGIVEVSPIQGKPLVSVEDLKRYVYDAGFTPRWVKVDLVGRLVRDETALWFEIGESEERIPVHDNEVAEGAPVGEALRVEAKAVEHEGAPFALEMERQRAVKNQ